MVKSKNRGKYQRNQIRAISISELSTSAEKIKLIARYGTLAPSTHNTQPWKLKISDDKLLVYIDFSKKIPVADPQYRDMHISIGALIKNVELAAQAFNIKTITVFSKNLAGKDPVAAITFSGLDEASVNNPTLLNSITERQNYRGFFSERFDKVALSKILKDISTSQKMVIVRHTNDKKLIERLAQLTVKGLRAAYATPEFRAEISSYINNNLSRKRHGLHGYTLRLNMPQSFVIPKIMKHKDIGAKLGALNYKSFILSPAVIVLTTKSDNPISWLEVGRVMEEFMVMATEKGMATSIYTAAIEMHGLRREVSRFLKIKAGEYPQVLFCVGNPSDTMPYSLRKNLEKVTS